MRLVDVSWAEPVNMLHVECDCGTKFRCPSNYSRVRCIGCGVIEMWHGVGPEAPAGSSWFADPVMENKVPTTRP